MFLKSEKNVKYVFSNTDCDQPTSTTANVVDDTTYYSDCAVHRCLNGFAPPYLSDYCVQAAGVDTRQHLRSANRQLPVVLRYRLNTYGRRAFSVAGPKVWNSLPDFIRDPTISADYFRCLLKTYLFARY